MDMKGVVTIPKWQYVVLNVLIVLLAINVIYSACERIQNKPEIHIHFQDERK